MESAEEKGERVVDGGVEEGRWLEGRGRRLKDGLEETHSSIGSAVPLMSRNDLWEVP